MNTLAPFFSFTNASKVSWASVPVFSVTKLVRLTGEMIETGARLCSWFGVPDHEGTILVAVLAMDAESILGVARSEPVNGSYPSLTPKHPQAHLFEREVWEQHGLVPVGHPWLKPVRHTYGNAPANAPFFRVEGGEVHEVAVGPVHAGVIEPGHFRFQCAGEEVMHLEIALGYQHRGIEEALMGGPHPKTMCQMETIAGDTTIAHATAHASVMEALGGV